MRLESPHHCYYEVLEDLRESVEQVDYIDHDTLRTIISVLSRQRQGLRWLPPTTREYMWIFTCI